MNYRTALSELDRLMTVHGISSLAWTADIDRHEMPYIKNINVRSLTGRSLHQTANGICPHSGVDVAVLATLFMYLSVGLWGESYYYGAGSSHPENTANRDDALSDAVHDLMVEEYRNECSN